jgi:YggT family protein
VTSIIVWLLTAYLVMLAGRAVLSWFPVRSGTFLAGLNSLLFDLTEPVLRPVRRVIPPAGMLDLSFLVVFVGIMILRGIVASSG